MPRSTLRPLRFRALIRTPAAHFHSTRILLSSSSHHKPPIEEPAPLSPRWLSEAKTRIGKCITFGLERPQVAEAGSILRELGTHWCELVAGSEGFLTGPGRRGLWKHDVMWGDMVRPIEEGADSIQELKTDFALGWALR